MKMMKQQRRHLSFITLGDGDFSFSLDLARYLATEENSAAADKIALYVTGIDSDASFRTKYRNCEYILSELDKIRKNQTHLSIAMQYEVNAILLQSDNDDHHENNDQQTPLSHTVPPRCDVVIFNHPHLGVEDAHLHAQFLKHLFYSIEKRWLKIGAATDDTDKNTNTTTTSVFYLVLAKGQYERWNCSDAAKCYGFVLQRRCDFTVTNISGSESSYSIRRHQSGKSFSKRYNGSEAFTYVRNSSSTATTIVQQHNDESSSVNQDFHLNLPWFTKDTTSKKNDDLVAASKFVCSSCDKAFDEKRSLKNHIKSKHEGLNGNSRERRQQCNKQNGDSVFCCELCNDRDFCNADALRDHRIAKHSGGSTATTSGITAATAQEITAQQDTHVHGDDDDVLRNDMTKTMCFGVCKICDYKYRNESDSQRHWNNFIPSTAQTDTKIRCQHCNRLFLQERAKSQHEKFCSIATPKT